MKTCLHYGLGLALAGTVVAWVFFFLGYHNDAEKLQSIQPINTAISLLLTLAFVILGIRAVREDSPDKTLTYGRGVGAGALIGLFSGIASGVLVYLYGTLVNPEFHDVLFELQMASAEAKGIPMDQLEKMEGMMRFLSGPGFIATTAAIFSPIVTTVMALAVSAFLKRAPARQETDVEASSAS